MARNGGKRWKTRVEEVESTEMEVCGGGLNERVTGGMMGGCLKGCLKCLTGGSSWIGALPLCQHCLL